MPNVRGLFVLNTLRFVRESYGEDAVEGTLALLPSDVQATFRGQIRDASWKPLEHVVAFMEAAQRRWAPGDREFHRRLGRFSGRQDRTQGGFAPMMADPLTAARMAPTAWRAFYDQGRLEVEDRGGGVVRLRVRDFPAHPAHCQRMCGAWEALVSSDAVRATVSEVACAASGSPCCEFEVQFSPP